MFTGIVEKVGEVTELSRSGTATVIVVATSFTDLALGESVAVNGACLTVTESREDRARFFVSDETLRLTNLSALQVGSKVNLERALTLSTRLSGHLVQGHVDGLARFEGAETLQSAEGLSYRVAFNLPHGLSRYCVHKGSIALNGTSLTLNRVDGDRVEILLIPHTWANTNLSALSQGDTVNVEVDLMAKYAEKLLAGHRPITSFAGTFGV